MMLIFQNVLIFITNNSVSKLRSLVVVCQFCTVILAGTDEPGLVHGSPVEKMPLIWLGHMCFQQGVAKDWTQFACVPF